MEERKKLQIVVGIIFLPAVLALSAPAAGEIIYVDGRAPGANDGSNWTNAYWCLQDALAGAIEQDEIRVAKGIYKPDCSVAISHSPDIIASGDRRATFQLINGVAIRGGYAGYGESDPDVRDIELYETVLSGDLDADDVNVTDPATLPNEPSRADNSYQVVTGSGTDETAVLDGFTIKGGFATLYTNRNGGGLINEYGSPRISNCAFIHNATQYFGGGVYNYYGSPVIENCTFVQNSAGSRGGAIYNYRSSPVVSGCTFMENSASVSGSGIHSSYGSLSLTGCMFSSNSSRIGAGIYSDETSADLVDCVFTHNWAEDDGGAIYFHKSEQSFKNCTFSANTAEYGGGAAYFHDSDPNLTNCIFMENRADYGGGMYNSGGKLVLNNCMVVANSAHGYGGGMYNISGSTILLSNSLVTANRASSYGGAMSCNRSHLTLTNCTFAENSGPKGSTIAFNSREQRSRSTGGIIACIIRDDADPFWINDQSTISISYSNIQGGWDGEGNIDSEPLFANPSGPDEIPGTEDDDYRLTILSPCVDAGDPGYAPAANKKDLAGSPRIVGSRVDMGAYEFQGVVHVDDDMAGTIGYGTEGDPFAEIQEAIDMAHDGYTIKVKPGVYGRIDFHGKAITIEGFAGAPVIQALQDDQPDAPGQDAVTFHTGEGPDSMLRNFIIKDAGTAISLNYGSSPTIINVTIVDNHFGIAAYENSNPHISNCIFRNNRDGDLFQCQVRYSCLEGGAAGEGNISVDPLFVDEANGDYHLRSEGWYWSERAQSWTYDENATSPCIDAGDPSSPLRDELVTMPRDPDGIYGINKRINMGAFGGTPQASIPPPDWTVDR